MTRTSEISAVLVSCPSEPDWRETVASLRNQSGIGEVIVAHRRGAAPAPLPDGARAVEASGDDPGSLYSCGLSAAALPFALLVQPFTRLEKGAVGQFLSAFVDPGVAMVLSSYREPGNESPTRIYADDSDLSETDLGFVKAFRVSALREVGHADGNLAHAFEYDLRLKLLDRYRSVTVQEPLYSLTRRRSEISEPGLGPIVPTESPYGGYSYLFYPGDKERELAEAFRRDLSRRGALCAPPLPIECPHVGASNPVVSVVIRTKNRRDLLLRAIRTVIEGTFEDFEIIVVDTGSTDGTREAIAAMRSARLVLIEADGANLAAAFNAGLKAARGRYVSELDSDDEYTPATLERQVAHLEANPDCALAISYYRLIDIAGNPIERFGVIEHAEFGRDNILRTSGAGAARTWHRCVLESLGGHDEQRFGDYAEDYDLILRAAERYRIDRVHEVLYLHRRHGTNSERVLTLDQTYEKKTLARRLALERRSRGRSG